MKLKPQMKVLKLEIDPDVQQRLDAMAKKLNTNVTGVMRRALQLFEVVLAKTDATGEVEFHFGDEKQVFLIEPEKPAPPLQLASRN